MPHRSATLLLGLALIAAATWAASVEEMPRLETTQEGIALTHLPDVLEIEEIAAQLRSGLTTTFVFRAETPGSSAGLRGGAHVAIRYELWDEVFHVEVLGIDGRVERSTLASREALLGWWRKLSLPLFGTPPASPAAGVRVRVALEVVPFSRAEQDATRRWLADGAQGSGESYSESPEDRGASLERVFSVLLATSIQRRALISYRWTLDFPGSNE
jgi:hypothetical protein